MVIEDVEDDNLTILPHFKSMNSNSIAKSVKPSSYDMIGAHTILLIMTVVVIHFHLYM